MGLSPALKQLISLQVRTLEELMDELDYANPNIQRMRRIKDEFMPKYKALRKRL